MGLHDLGARVLFSAIAHITSIPFFLFFVFCFLINFYLFFCSGTQVRTSSNVINIIKHGY